MAPVVLMPGLPSELELRKRRRSVDRTMLKKVLAVALIVCGMGLASQAAALDKTSPEFLGTYTPPEPASPANEVGYINDLISVPNNTTATISGITYVRSGNNCDGVGSCPTAVEAGNVRNETGSNSVDVTGFTYLIGKYDGPNGGGIVWFVGDLTGVQTIPQASFGKDDSQFGLSHWTLFNPGVTTVPEPGTLLLVGTGLVAVGLWRRKR
jgi:hypothetical protein